MIFESEVGTKYRGSTQCVKVKRWTNNEDQLLLALVSKFAGNWTKIAHEIERKRGKNDEIKTSADCIKRWASLNNQKPKNWTEEENKKLVNLVDTKGK